MSECYGSATLFYGFCLDEDYVDKLMNDKKFNKKFENWLVNDDDFKGCHVETNGDEDGINYYVSVYSITTEHLNPTKIQNLDILACEAKDNNWNKSLTNFAKYFKMKDISEKDFGWHLIADYGR